jgi:hypothetical protein
LASLLPHLHEVSGDRVLFVEGGDDLSRLRIDLLPQLPLTLIVGAGRTIPVDWLEECEGDAVRVVVIPSDTYDPERPDRRLADLRPPIVPLDYLAEGHF